MLAHKLSGYKGIAIAYGAFQEYYQGDILRNQSASATSWIGSIQATLIDVTGIVAISAISAISASGSLTLQIWTHGITKLGEPLVEPLS